MYAKLGIPTSCIFATNVGGRDSTSLKRFVSV